jgi:hypothetical protein
MLGITLNLADSSASIECTHIPGTVSTIDFGVSENVDIYNSFHDQDLHSEGGRFIENNFYRFL